LKSAGQEILNIPPENTKAVAPWKEECPLSFLTSLGGGRYIAAVLRRRDFLRLGLTGAGLSFLGTACDKKQATNPWKPAEPPEDLPVYELTDGRTLYDDFDGNGNFQTYDNQNLAVAGELSAKIWTAYEGSEIVPDPAAPALFSAIDERSERAEDRFRDSPLQGNRSGYVLKITNRPDESWTRCILSNPSSIKFVDFRSLSFNVMLSSVSSAPGFSAGSDYHTTIPEQPPGKSWVGQIILNKSSSGNVRVFGRYFNVNLGYDVVDFLGEVQLDAWVKLRVDIITKKDDPSLGDDELRLDYYLNGVLKASRIPEDSQILIDPERTGLGPQRSFVVVREEGAGDCMAFFDNVRAVYQNRIR